MQFSPNSKKFKKLLIDGKPAEDFENFLLIEFSTGDLIKKKSIYQ